MKLLTITLLIIFTAIVIAHLVYVAPPVDPGKPLTISERSPDDHRAFQTLLDQMVTGWNSGNGVLYAGVFTENADYIAFNGERFTGRKSIADSHQDLFDGFLKVKIPGHSLFQSIRTCRFEALHSTSFHSLHCVYDPPSSCSLHKRS